IPKRAEILRREEGEAADITIAACAAPVGILRANCLRRILDDAQMACMRYLHQSGHVRHLPVQMHRHDRPHALAFTGHEATLAALAIVLYEGLYRVGRQVERLWIDVAEHGGRTCTRDGSRRCKERKRAGDHCVTGT